MKPIDYTRTPLPFLPGWEEKAAKRRAAKDAFAQRASIKRYRAIQSTTENRLTKEEWQEIQVRYFHRCYYCLQPKKLTQDHVIPISKGGTHTKDNIVPACQPCNSRKGNRPAETYNPFFPSDG